MGRNYPAKDDLRVVVVVMNMCHGPEELSGKLKTCLQILPIPVYITLQGDVSS